MSGLLQRLAAQTMSKMNTVRPLSRFRYAAPFLPESTADLDQHTHTRAASIQSDHEQFHLDQSDEKRERVTAHSKPPANPHAENGVQPHVEMPSVSLESIVTHPVAESVTASIHDSQSSSTDRSSFDSVPASVSSPSRQIHSVSEKAITEFFAGPEHIETDDAIGSPAIHTAHSIHHVHRAESDTVPSLLPLTKPAQVAAWNTPGIMQRGNADRSMQTNRAQERGKETTEVHVHIGRIEVRATAATAPARKTPARSPMMNLDDYLKQRDGRQR